MNIKTMIRILCTPSCWTRNCKSSRELSRFFNERLDAGEVPVQNDFYYASLGGVSFWLGNFPYAYGEPALTYAGRKVMPDRATVFRLHDAIPPTLPSLPALLKALRESQS